jgi:hypothetical protein
MKITSYTIIVILINIQFQYAQNIQVYKSKSITPDSSKTIQSINHSNQIDPYKSKNVEVYKRKEIEVYKGRSIEPNQIKDSKNSPVKNPKVKTSNSQNNVKNLIGVWHTKIPGAVWQSPSGRDGYNNLHVSGGAASGDLVIYKNGTYIWNSYGGKKGRWGEGDSDYPIVLNDKVENKKWKVCFDAKHSGGRDIIIWDGNIWYDGKK